MQLNVTCRQYREMNDQLVWYPINAGEQFTDMFETRDKAFFVDETRIVMLDPRTREVRIDDGTPGGIVLVLSKTSAEVVEYMLS